MKQTFVARTALGGVGEQKQTDFLGMISFRAGNEPPKQRFDTKTGLSEEFLNLLGRSLF